MDARVHRPLRVIVFNASGIWRRRYELSKQLQDSHIDVSLLSETYLKPHQRFYIPNYHFCRTDRFPGRKGIPPQPCRPMLYVRYAHMTKAKPIYKRQTHPLVREDAT
jgi:hypothetical protein